MGKIGWSGFRSNGRNSMDEISWSGFRSNGRNSMGEIGLGQFGCPKFFLRLRRNPVGGPPRIRAPSRKFRSFDTATHSTRNGIRKRTGSPPKYLQAARACTAAWQYTSKVGRVSHLERTSGTSHAVTQGQQPHWIACTKRSTTGSLTDPSLLALYLGQRRAQWCFIVAATRLGLIVTLTARTAPRAATSSVVLYRSDHYCWLCCRALVAQQW